VPTNGIFCYQCYICARGKKSSKNGPSFLTGFTFVSVTDFHVFPMRYKNSSHLLIEKEILMYNFTATVVQLVVCNVCDFEAMTVCEFLVMTVLNGIQHSDA